MIYNFLRSLTTSQLFMPTCWWLFIWRIITPCCVLSLFTKKSFQSFLFLLRWTSWTWFLILLVNWNSDRQWSLFINILFSRFNRRILFFTRRRDLLLWLFNLRVLIDWFIWFIVINAWKSYFLLII